MSKTMSPVVTDQVLSSKMGGHQSLTSPHLWRKIVKTFVLVNHVTHLTAPMI